MDRASRSPERRSPSPPSGAGAALRKEGGGLLSGCNRPSDRKSRNGRTVRDGAVVGYIRVSSVGQDYAYQRSAIDVAARARGERVGEWFGDVASGSTLERPELARLRAALDVRRVRQVWVWRLDRLTRSGISDTLASVEHVRRSGAELVSVADRVALDGGPTGELVLAVLAWCAQMELAKIHENQDAARVRMRQQGRAWGRPPLPDPLRDAVSAAASQGLSCRAIARQLKVSKTWVAGVLSELGPKAAAENMPLDTGLTSVRKPTL